MDSANYVLEALRDVTSGVLDVGFVLINSDLFDDLDVLNVAFCCRTREVEEIRWPAIRIGERERDELILWHVVGRSAEKNRRESLFPDTSLDVSIQVQRGREDVDG